MRKIDIPTQYVVLTRYISRYPSCGTNYSSTDSRFTAPVAGWYQFNCSWTAANNADVDGTIGFHKNNVRSGANGTVSQPNTGGSYDGHSISSTIYLAKVGE